MAVFTPRGSVERLTDRFRLAEGPFTTIQLGDLMSRLAQDQTAEQIEDLLVDLRETTGNIKEASVRLDLLLGESLGLVESGEALVNENRPALRSGVEDAEFTLQSIATSITMILQNLERASQELAGLTGKINADPKVIVTGEPEPEGPFR